MPESKLTYNQKAIKEKWDTATTGVKLDKDMTKQLQSYIIGCSDYTLLAALTDIVRIAHKRTPIYSGKKIATAKDLNEHLVHKRFVYDFPYLCKARLRQSHRGTWRVVFNKTRDELVGIFNYHKDKTSTWSGEGIKSNTAGGPGPEEN